MGPNWGRARGQDYRSKASSLDASLSGAGCCAISSGGRWKSKSETSTAGEEKHRGAEWARGGSVSGVDEAKKWV